MRPRRHHVLHVAVHEHVCAPLARTYLLLGPRLAARVLIQLFLADYLAFVRQELAFYGFAHFFFVYYLSRIKFRCVGACIGLEIGLDGVVDGTRVWTQ